MPTAPTAPANAASHSTASNCAIVLEGISVRYQGAPVLRKLSARFACGQRWAIVGPNGCGKSTLLKAAMRLLHCEAGQVHWQNLRRADMAYLPQQAGIDRNLPVRVQDLVALGLWHELRWWRGLSRTQWARVHAALDQVGLLAQARVPIAALSSGQFQRVLFARMLVQGARMLLLDEPFNAVDAATTADLLHVLHGCARQGAGIVAVVHDLAQARSHFDHILRLAPSAPPISSGSAGTSFGTNTDPATPHACAQATASAAVHAGLGPDAAQMGTAAVSAAAPHSAWVNTASGTHAGADGAIATRHASTATAPIGHGALAAQQPRHNASHRARQVGSHGSHAGGAAIAQAAGLAPRPHAARLATPFAHQG